MKVLIIPKPEPADAVTSGIGRYVGILEKHLGPEIEVVHLPGAPHEEDRRLFRPIEARQSRVQKLVPEWLRLSAGYIRDTLSLAKQLRPYRDQVDLIHVNRVGCEIQTIAARMAGFRKIVATIHNLPGEDIAAQHWVRRLVERLSFACATRLISVSHATYEAWHDRINLKPEDVTVIHNGMDPPEPELHPRDEARRKLGIPEEAVVFGICARLHPMKGHEVLLEAFAGLLQSQAKGEAQRAKSASDAALGPSLVLLVAGSGPEEGRIRAKIAELGIGSHVRMLGRVNDVMGFMAMLDVHVLPSITLESMPFAVVEAMLAGIPSIVSDVGGAKEAVSDADGGLVVPRGDVGALARAMKAYMESQARRNEAGHRGRDYARAHLTGDVMARETMNIYRKVAGCPKDQGRD